MTRVSDTPNRSVVGAFGSDAHRETAMPVTRCVCHRLPFEDLKARAAASSLTFEQLRRETGCAAGCGMCEPYIRLMLITGETSFRVLSATAIRKYLRDRGVDENAMDIQIAQTQQVPQADRASA